MGDTQRGAAEFPVSAPQDSAPCFSAAFNLGGLRTRVDPSWPPCVFSRSVNWRVPIALIVVVTVLAVGTTHAALVCAASRHPTSEHCRGSSGEHPPASHRGTPPCCSPDASVSPGQGLKRATSTFSPGLFDHGLLLAKLLPVGPTLGLSLPRLVRSSSGYPSSSPPRRILLSTFLL